MTTDDFQLQFDDGQQSKTLILPPDAPVIALSIRQPWAWLIVHAGKDIENRNWSSKFRGRFLIHAAKGMTRQEYEDACDFVHDVVDSMIRIPSFDSLPRGGIVGESEVTDCVSYSTSRWFVGNYGLVWGKYYVINCWWVGRFVYTFCWK